LVGSDLTSLYPRAAAALPKTGYLRALGAEGILSLRPELILASADAGPPAALAQVAAAGVRIVTLAEAHTEEAALTRVAQVGAALGREAQADAMLAAMRADLNQARADVAGAAGRPRVLFLLSAGRGAPSAAGADTAAEAMIALAGGVNAVQGFRSYKPLSAEAALLAAPDVIVTTTDTLRGIGGEAGLLALPGLGAARARVLAFDALYLLGFGPRLAHATRDLAAALHPYSAIRPLPARPWAEPA
jgi:iron complex transport system substrate-binding protein